MRFGVNNADQLLVKRHSASRAGQFRQQPVIEPFTPTEPTALTVKSYSGNQGQVQPVQRQASATGSRLADAEATGHDIGFRVPNFSGLVVGVLSVVARERHPFAGSQRSMHERPEVGLVGQRSKEKNGGSGFPDWLIQQFRAHQPSRFRPLSRRQPSECGANGMAQRGLLVGDGLCAHG